MEPFSLYLHVPFCRHRCSYCDFNTFAGQERMIPAYVRALVQEIEQVSAAAPRAGANDRLPVHTVFFGGGTPSLLSVDQLSEVLGALRLHFVVRKDAEITLEANPGTVSPEYLLELRRLGVNRLSFGMQSAHPDDLRLLERQHDFFDVAQAVRWARRAGFDNLSVDLIFGLPEQTLERWQATLDRAVGMQVDHISLYALTIEHGTPLQKRWAHGSIPLVDDDLAADMYEHAIRRLPEDGFEQYEVSNWARRSGGDLMTCRHNLQYWRSLPYLGLGAGAHGFVPGSVLAVSSGVDGQVATPASGFRTMNVGGIRPFIERCAAGRAPGAFPAGPAARRVIPIDRKTEMQERMMVGLRLTQEGIGAAEFQSRFGSPLEQVFGAEIERLVGLGLLQWMGGAGSALRLTPRGLMVGNQVFMQFVS